MLTLLNLFKIAVALLRQVVPAQALALGVQLARDAATRFLDNADRRAWVIRELVARLQVSESVARLIVELAVQQLKREASAA